jgi:two-component system NarL family response regulator
MTIRVLLADDHTLIRVGMASVINQEADMTVVAQASNGREVVELHREHRPDVTVMDMRMPGLAGDAATLAILDEDPRARVLVLTMHGGDGAVDRALRAGAHGYLLKDVPTEELLAAIRALHAGKRYIPAEVGEKLAQRAQRDPLAPRDIQILELVARGLTNKQIADRLGSTENSMKHMVADILAKLGAHDRANAVAIAVERNLIDLGELNLGG